MSDPASAPEPGVPVTVDELTTLVLAPNPGAMTLEGTNTYLLGEPGGGEVIVVDPGPADDAHRRAIESAAEACDARIVAVVVTHHHPDHAAAAGWAGRWQAPLWAFDPALLDVVAEPLGDTAVLQRAGVGLEALHTPGHASDHVCLRVTASGAVLTGDHVLGRGTTVVAWPDGDMAAYLDSLERLRSVGATALYPGHGPRLDDPVGAVDHYLAHRREREQQILAALADGHATAADIVAAVYADVDPALHPAAERSVLAHLDKLERAGRVRCSTTAERAADIPYTLRALDM